MWNPSLFSSTHAERMTFWKLEARQGEGLAEAADRGSRAGVEVGNDLRTRVTVLNKLLTELVRRIRHPESETAGLLRIALENDQAIAETIEGVAGG